MLALCLAAVGLNHTKAIADENAPKSSSEIIGTVDMQTGAVSFSEGVIVNKSEKDMQINTYRLNMLDSSISNVVWTVFVDNQEIYKGKAGEEKIVLSAPLLFKSGQTSTMKVTADGLSSDLAKSLVDKTVAESTSDYEEAVCSVCGYEFVGDPSSISTGRGGCKNCGTIWCASPCHLKQKNKERCPECSKTNCKFQ